MSDQNSNNGTNAAKKDYYFGGVKVYDLEKIEQEVLQESIYLDVFAGSDQIFKEDCAKLSQEDISSKFSSLQAYSFKYRTDEFPTNNFPEGIQYGFMAQEVENLFPHLVKKDSNGNRYINYTQTIPLMAETIKNLSDRIASLEKKLAE